MTEFFTYEQLAARYQEERSNPSWEPVRLGLGTIDSEIRGVSPGQLLGIAARTAVGKTWLAQTIEHNFSVRDDAGILSLSLEMPGEEWAERALAIGLGLAPERIESLAKEKRLLESAAPFFVRARHIRVTEQRVHLDNLAPLTALVRESLTVPLRLVIIDYLGMLKANARDAYERASLLAVSLKDYAKAEHVAVVCAMQLSRAAGDGSTPVSREMLRDSGAIEESCDFLLGCWRPGKAEDAEPELKDVLRVKVLKSRKGEDGRTVDLFFHPESRRVYDPARNVEEVLAL